LVIGLPMDKPAHCADLFLAYEARAKSSNARISDPFRQKAGEFQKKEDSGKGVTNPLPSMDNKGWRS
jgi:hypothetical protein